MRLKKNLFLLGLLALAVIIATGCPHKNEPVPEPTPEPSEPIKVTGITLAKNTLYLDKNAQYQLQVSVYPENATNKKVSYTSLDTSVATVTETGLVTYVGGAGTEATIVIMAENGAINTTCKVASSTILLGRWPQTKGSPPLMAPYQDESVGMFKYEKYKNGSFLRRDSTCYKVEPITWRIVTDDYYGDGSGKKLYVADKVLYSQVPFYFNADGPDRPSGVSATDYGYSGIRAWLNGLECNSPMASGYGPDEAYVGKGFLQTAFDPDEQKKILTTTVKYGGYYGGYDEAYADVKDKIFLLSPREVTNTDWGFLHRIPSYEDTAPDKDRVKTSTDLANATTWYLRNGGVDFGNAYVWYVDAEGRIKSTAMTDKTIGIVPALCID